MKKELREKVYQKCDGHCAYCGQKIKYSEMQEDHILALHRGGTDTIDNKNPACRSCNATKATYTVEEFSQRLIDDVDRLRRDSTKFRILERFGIVEQRKARLTFYFEREFDKSRGMLY